MHKKEILLFTLTLLTSTLWGQIGGQNTYEFLNLPPSARVAGLGGNIIAVTGDDLVLGNQNPGLLNPSMSNQFSANAVAYLAGINYGYVSYGRYSDSLELTFSGGIQYIYYGNFLRAEPNGNVTGSFSAGEYALIIGGAKQDGRFSYGANLKLIYSQLETYHSFGVGADIGAVYYDTARELCFAGVIKNIGRQIKPYRKGNREPIPFDTQIGISKKLAHLPFRISVTYHHLHQFDIRYDDPNDNKATSIFGTEDDEKEKKYVIDKFFRHMVFGGELYLSNNFSVFMGYNHLRRKELSTEGRRGLTGFSFGTGIMIKKIQIRYGRATYHVAGASNHLSISTNLTRFFNPSPIPMSNELQGN